jgi:hypothetical protein
MANDSEQFFQDAKQSFRLAGSAPTIGQAERFAAMGRDYLRLAQEAAEIVQKPSRYASMWPW